MPALTLNLSDTEIAQIKAIARDQSDRFDGVKPVGLEEMAEALLTGHLVLIRDCGGILPSSAPKGGKPGKVTGKRGVSLSGGGNA